MQKYYRALNLPPNASPRKIKEQYRKLVKRYHPDRLTDPAAKTRSAERFREITEAYEALSEIVRRSRLNPTERKLDFLYGQGKQFLEQKKWSKAMIVFNEILTLDASYRDVLTCLREARRQHKKMAEQYTQANALFRQKKWVEAMASFELILDEDPNYRDAAIKFKKARREQLMSDFMSQY